MSVEILSFLYLSGAVGSFLYFWNLQYVDVMGDDPIALFLLATFCVGIALLWPLYLPLFLALWGPLTKHFGMRDR